MDYLFLFNYFLILTINTIKLSELMVFQIYIIIKLFAAVH